MLFVKVRGTHRWKGPFFILVALIFVTFLATAETPTGMPRVIDGDTIEIAGERIRLHGIDAP